MRSTSGSDFISNKNKQEMIEENDTMMDCYDDDENNTNTNSNSNNDAVGDEDDDDDDSESDQDETFEPLFRSMQLVQPTESSLFSVHRFQQQQTHQRQYQGSNSYSVGPNSGLNPYQQQFVDPKLRLSSTNLKQQEHLNQQCRTPIQLKPLSKSKYELARASIGWMKPQFAKLGMFCEVSKYNTEFHVKYHQQVLDGLTELFCQHSIQVQYVNGPIVKAICQPLLDKVEFQVLIWLNRTELNKMIVEVDCISGDKIPFHSLYANMIIQTVQDCSISPPKPIVLSSNPDPIKTSAIESNKSELERTSQLLDHCKYRLGMKTIYDIEPQDFIPAALTAVKQRLCSGRYDVQGMVLETLQQLTNPHISGSDTAKVVSTAVLLGRYIDSKYSSCKEDDTLKIIQYNLLYLAFTGQSIDGIYTETDLKQHSLQALTIVAQSINFIDNTSDMKFFATYAKSILPSSHGSFVHVLLKLVSNAKAEPHLAYLAMHILSALCQYGGTTDDEVYAQIETNVKCIQQAYQIGSIQHVALLQATERMIYQYNNSTN